MRKRYSRSYTVLSFLTMFSYRELPFGRLFSVNVIRETCARNRTRDRVSADVPMVPDWFRVYRRMELAVVSASGVPLPVERHCPAQVGAPAVCCGVRYSIGCLHGPSCRRKRRAGCMGRCRGRRCAGHLRCRQSCLFRRRSYRKRRCQSK